MGTQNMIGTIRFVRQDGFPEACQQACIAMLADVTLDVVIKALGEKRLSSFVRRDYLTSHQVDCPNWAYWIEAVGHNSIAALERKHPTLWLTLGSCRDFSYGHAVILHEGDLYDPWSGMNPAWPWDRYVVMATPVTKFSEGR